MDDDGQVMETKKARWKKAPPELVARFDEAFPTIAGGERRLMFGYPAGFVNGNMFGGVHQDRVIVRLAGDQVKTLKGARPFEPMPGRTMTGYVELPAAVTERSSSLRTWLERAASETAKLPPKQPKTRRAPKSAGTKTVKRTRTGRA